MKRTAIRFLWFFVGCFLLSMAVVPLIGFGVSIANVNLDPTGLMKEFVPSMQELIVLNILYSAEAAIGLLCIRQGFKQSKSF